MNINESREVVLAASHLLIDSFCRLYNSKKKWAYSFALTMAKLIATMIDVPEDLKGGDEALKYIANTLRERNEKNGNDNEV